MRLCRHWRRRYDKRYNNRTILSDKQCNTQIRSKSENGVYAIIPDFTVFIQKYTGVCDATLFRIIRTKMSRVPFTFIAKGLKPIIMLLMITTLFNLFLTTDGKLLFHAWIFKITEGGLRTAVYMVIRLIYLIIGSSLMTLTTTPNELTDGIER